MTPDSRGQEREVISSLYCCHEYFDIGNSDGTNEAEDTCKLVLTEGALEPREDA